MPTAARLRAPWWKYVVISLAAIGALLIVAAVVTLYAFAKLTGPIIAPLFGGVPQISGKIVDAITDQPVAGMDVCLVALARGVNGAEVDRSETTQTDASGKFSFASSAQRGFGFAGYQIAITDPAAQMSQFCGKTRDVLTSPYFFSQELLAASHRTTLYFPVALVERRNNDPSDQTTYGPMLQKFADPANIRVELIPLLPDSNACDAIHDPTQAEFCRKMNDTGEADFIRKYRPAPQQKR